MRSRVRPADPAYSTGACDDPSIGGSPEHSRAVADARPNGEYIYAELPHKIRHYVGTPRQCARMRYADWWNDR